MISMRVNVRDFRFAAKPIYIKTLTESHREFLNRSGGFVKKVAQRSMRRGTFSKRSRRRLRSKPGRPPRKWRGDIPRTMAYRLAPDGRAVYIEPKRYAGSDVVDVLEAGGRSTVYEFGEALGEGHDRPVSIQPRPYMQPARDKIEPTLSRIWEDSFRLKRRGRGI